MHAWPGAGGEQLDLTATSFSHADRMRLLPVSVKTRGKSKSFTKQAVQTSTAQAPKLVGWVDTRVVLSGQHEW